MTQTLEIKAPKAPTEQIKEEPQIIWEKLPEDFILPDEPVESIAQPLLAAALTEALVLAGLIAAETLIASNMAICTNVNGKTVVKAPDWFYVPRVLPVAPGVISRSYTPHTEGDLPTVVMEFLSATETGEYSVIPTYPYGKMWYYERILRIPIYVIFDPSDGTLEIRRLNSSGNYEIQTLDQQGRYFIPEMNLFLGVWQGKRLENKNTIYWLRWWDSDGKMLLWGSERISLEHQQTQAERQRADAERQRADAERQRAEAESQKAEAQSQRADAESQRADAERQRADAKQQKVEEESQRADAERQRAEAESQKAEVERQRAEAERQRADAAELEVARLRSLLEQAGS